MRGWIVGVGLMLLLGCSGLLEQGFEVRGTEIQQHAPIPADFPLRPHPSARQDSSTSLTSDTSIIHIVKYELDEGTEMDEVLDFYEQALTEAGHRPQREDTKVQVSQDGEFIKASVNTWATPDMLTLSWSRPRAQADPETAPE